METLHCLFNTFSMKDNTQTTFPSLCLSPWCTNNSLLYCIAKQEGRLWGHCLGVMGLLCCLRKEQFVWIRIGWFCFPPSSFLISRVWFPHFIIHKTYRQPWNLDWDNVDWSEMNDLETWLQEWFMNYIRGMNGWLVMF